MVKVVFVESLDALAEHGGGREERGAENPFFRVETLRKRPVNIR
jgi:hypothetical protein